MLRYLARSRASVFVAIAALALFGVSAQALLGGSIPSVACPLPLPLVVLAFSGVPRGVVVAIPSVAFVLWCFPIFKGRPIPSRRTAMAATLVALGSALAFGFGWRWGVEYEGHSYTLATALISAGLAAATSAALLVSRRVPSVAINVTASLLLFAWAFTFAAPYLGELP